MPTANERCKHGVRWEQRCPSCAPSSKQALHQHAMNVLESANWMHECGYRTRGQQLEAAAKALDDAARAADEPSGERCLCAQPDPHCQHCNGTGKLSDKYVRASDEHGGLRDGCTMKQYTDELTRDVIPQPPRVGMDTPWPLHDVLAKLIEATEHLLTVHDCDVHGHEEFRTAAEAGKRLLPETKPATTLCGCDAPYREGYECLNEFNSANVQCKRLQVETNAAPVAYRKFRDPQYDYSDRYRYRDAGSYGAPEGWEPLYTARAVTACADCGRADGTHASNCEF